MGKQQRWRTIACPKCAAAPNQNCMSEPGKFGTVCFERRQAAEGVVTKVLLKASPSKA